MLWAKSQMERISKLIKTAVLLHGTVIIFPTQQITIMVNKLNIRKPTLFKYTQDTTKQLKQDN